MLTNVRFMRTIVRNMRTTNKNLIDWLFPEARKRVLNLLLSDPNSRWYLRDIVRRTGCAIGAVRRELTGLAQAEIVTKAKDGNRTYYQVNTNCPVYADLAGLLRKTTGLADVLEKALGGLSEKIAVAFVYGSFAKGTATAASDVDLMVIGDCTFGQVVQAVHSWQDKIHREINPSVYPAAEFKQKISQQHHFLGSIMREEKIFLIGDEDELARLVE